MNTRYRSEVANFVINSVDKKIEVKRQKHSELGLEREKTEEQTNGSMQNK